MESKLRNKKDSRLEGILSLGVGAGLALFHQTQMYNLMDKAGMYNLNELGTYSKLASLEGAGYTTAISLGCISLLFGGMYIGNKLGEFIKRVK